MTPREELIALLDEVHGALFYGSSWDWDEAVRQWGSRHSGIEWLETALALLKDLPMEVRSDPKRFEHWSWAFALLLEIWLRRNPEIAIPLVAPLLNEPGIRAIALEAISWVTNPDLIPYFEPLAARCAELTGDEAIDLVYALVD